MINKLRFDIGDCCFYAELPFAPSEGDFLIIAGKNKETGETREITIKIPPDSLVYNAIEGEWQLRPNIHESINRKIELRDISSDEEIQI